MPTEETRAVLERAMSFTPGDYEALGRELIADDIVNHGPEGDDHGRAEWMQRQRAIDAFTDREAGYDVTFADGDICGFRYRFTGAHTGQHDDIGLPPTGERISITGVTIFRVADGKIVESWAQPDRLALIQQLGVRIGV